MTEIQRQEILSKNSKGLEDSDFPFIPSICNFDSLLMKEKKQKKNTKHIFLAVKKPVW